MRDHPSVRVHLPLATASALLLTGSACGALPAPVTSPIASTVAEESPSTSPVAATPSPTIDLPADVSLGAAASGVVWVLVAHEELFRSMDSGSTWESRPLPRGWVPGAMGDHISFVDGSTGFILQSGSPESQCSAAGSDLWRTTDGGLTWTDLTVTDAGGVPDPSGVHEQGCKSGISAVTASNVFISVTDNERPATVYRSSDAGRTWTQSSAFPSPSGVSATQGAGVSRSLGVHAFGAALFTVWDGSADAEFYAVYRSTDGGADWSYVSMAPELTVVGFLSAVHWIQIGAPGESRETTDSGQTWHTFDTGYSQAAPVNPDVEFGDSRTGYATVRGSIQRSEDAGVNWTRISTPGVSGGG